MDKYGSAAAKIIDTQQLLIGPLARNLALKVQGLVFAPNGEISFEGNPKEALNNLVVRYYNLFGQTSVQVSIEALKDMQDGPSAEDLPEILKESGRIRNN